MRRKFSDTPMAEMTALARAVSNTEGDPALRCGDGVARKLLSKKFALLTALAPVRKLLKWVHMRRAPGGYGYIISRTIFLDREVEALEFDQLVILGAGFDSRAYRIPRLAGTTVFEVDHPELLAVKRERIRAAFGRLPPGVRYVPTDFNIDSLPAELSKAGYDKKKKTLFIWEGVTMYLSRRAVEDVLRFIAKNARKGSQLILDFAYGELLEGNTNFYGAPEYIAMTRAKNEPITFGLKRPECDRFLSKLGLKLVEHVDADALERRFFAGGGGEPLLKVYGFFHLIVAKVV